MTLGKNLPTLRFSSHRVSFSVFLQARRLGGKKPVVWIASPGNAEGRKRQSLAHGGAFPPAAPLPAWEARRESHRADSEGGPPRGFGTRARRRHGRALRGNSLRPKPLASSHPAAGPWEGSSSSGRGVKQSTELPVPTAAKTPGCPPTPCSCSLYVLSGSNRCPLITSLLSDSANKKGHVRQVRSSVVSLLPQPTLKYLS